MSATMRPTRPKPTITTLPGSRRASPSWASALLSMRRPATRPSFPRIGVMVSPSAVTICQKAAVSGRINCAAVAEPSTISVVSEGEPISTPVSAATPVLLPARRSNKAVTTVLTASTASSATRMLCQLARTRARSTLMPMVMRKMPSPSPRNGAVIASTSPRYSVSAITIPAMSAPSTAEKPMAEVTRLATMTTSRHAARKTSGFLVRAACAKRLGRRSRPPNSKPTATAPPSNKVPSSGPTPAAALGAMAPSAKTMGTSATSSNSSIPSAARPTADRVPTIGRTIAVEDSASARPRPMEPGNPCPMRCSPPPMMTAQASSSAAPTPNTIRRIDHKRRKDSSSPIEKSRSTMPSSANGSIRCELEIVM